MTALVAACLAVVPGCSGSSKTERWGELQYRDSDVRTPSEQIAAQRALQADHSSLTGPNEPRPAKMFSQTMTEKERRRFQQRRVDALREQAEEYRRQTQRRYREMLEAQQKSQQSKRGR